MKRRFILTYSWNIKIKLTFQPSGHQIHQCFDIDYIFNLKLSIQIVENYIVSGDQLPFERNHNEVFCHFWQITALAANISKEQKEFEKKSSKIYIFKSHVQKKQKFFKFFFSLVLFLFYFIKLNLLFDLLSVNASLRFMFVCDFLIWDQKQTRPTDCTLKFLILSKSNISLSLFFIYSFNHLYVIII